MNNDNNPNTSSEQCGLNTGESFYLIGQTTDKLKDNQHNFTREPAQPN